MKSKFPALIVFLLSCVGASAATDPVEKDFIYKKTPQGEQKLVVTLPPDAKPGGKHAAIVFFSGGAWSNSNINQFAEQATYLARRGMVAVRVDYRVSKTHNVGPDKCVEDARSAVRWVRAHAAELGIDSDRVAASGASAGGHLAACTATPVSPDAETDDLKISCAPNALVLLNCVADLTIGGMATRAGGAEMARRISPVLHVSAKTPPTLIMDGAEDNWVSTAKQFTDKATSLGVRCEFYVAEGEGHQFAGRSPWREATIRKVDEFFVSLGWLTGPPIMALPKDAAWVRYQPDPSAKPNEISSQTKLFEMHANRKKMMERKAGAEAAKPDDAPKKPEAAPGASPAPTAAAADPKKGISEDKRAQFMKRRQELKAGTPAPKAEDAPQKPESAPDAATKPNEDIKPLAKAEDKPSATPEPAPARTPRSTDKLLEMRKRLMERKAGTPATKPDDAAKKSGAAPDATPAPSAADPRKGISNDKRAEFMKRRMQQKPGTPAPQKPEGAPSATAPTGAVDVQITSEKSVPINPRVYGTWCEEMFGKGLANEPEYIAALVELKFKTFLFPGGSLSYYHHPKGPGGFNMRPEELGHSKYGEQGSARKKNQPGSDRSDLAETIVAHYLKGNSDPDYFEQYIHFVKASGGESVFVANILNGTIEELDEYLTRLKAEHVPIAAVVLGVEMHLGHAAQEIGGMDGYVERIKPYIAFLQKKYPGVPIVAHSTPVGRAVELARAAHHDWNHALAKLPGISGFSQYGWTEFIGMAGRQAGSGTAATQTPEEAWRQFDEFVQTFSSRQIVAYQKDWGDDKKMFLTQWGTHANRNTPVQGLHIASYYCFLAQYNAAHGDYFPVATSAVNLAKDVSRNAHEGGTLYREKIELLNPYLYTKPFRHLFSGDKKLTTASVQNDANVKALAAVGSDGRNYVYLLNSGPAIALGKLSMNGTTQAADAQVEVESVWGDPAFKSDDASAPAKTFVGQKNLRSVVLEPFSLTLLILPKDAQQKIASSGKATATLAIAPSKTPAQGGTPAKASPEKQPATDTPAEKTQRPKRSADQKVYDKNAEPHPDLEDVSFGSHELLKLDLWKAKSDQPTPILAFFHGGGGDKLMYRGDPLLKFCLSHGISVAAVNYRPNHSFPAPMPMQDAGRAIQFLRSKANEYHIAPKRVAAYGTSLGANVAIAVAYGDDLASPQGSDPVLRESSRLCFLIAADAGGGFAGSAQVTKDAPPILMTYNMALKELGNPKDTPIRELLHNPALGLPFRRKLDAEGVENYLYHGGDQAPPDAEEKFILKYFQGR